MKQRVTAVTAGYSGYSVTLNVNPRNHIKKKKKEERVNIKEFAVTAVTYCNPVTNSFTLQGQ